MRTTKSVDMVVQEGKERPDVFIIRMFSPNVLIIEFRDHHVVTQPNSKCENVINCLTQKLNDNMQAWREKNCPCSLR